MIQIRKQLSPKIADSEHYLPHQPPHSCPSIQAADKRYMLAVCHQNHNHTYTSSAKANVKTIFMTRFDNLIYLIRTFNLYNYCLSIFDLQIKCKRRIICP